ncbi:MAG: DUF1566 domain-containing protein [Thermodesulfobacteriota bacterium]
MSEFILKTGLNYCYDFKGNKISCLDSGQDAEYSTGPEIPQPRFISAGMGLVQDKYTQLVWCKESDVSIFPLTWQESLRLISALNEEKFLGRSDWRMPNRRELRSLIDHQQRMPALPSENPFSGIQESWYWTGTSSAQFPDYAWYIHLAGGRMFWGRKDQQAFCRPVCTASNRILATGQSTCLDNDGRITECEGIYTLADGVESAGWKGRFVQNDMGIEDRLTGLLWHLNPFWSGREVNWQDALDLIRKLNHSGAGNWRLPNINELESIVDCSRHTPALSLSFPSEKVREVYWSSSTSGFETDWAYALYMYKGAVGVGHKSSAEYAVWPVTDMRNTG